MKKYFSFVIVALLFLVACGDVSEEESVDPDEQAERAALPLDVEILTEEDAFDPGEEGKIEILVTEGDENVADADEVEFEIGEVGKEDEHEKIDGDNDGDGNYSLAYTFTEEGIYYVIPHVTARGKHTMPKREFFVGDVDESDRIESDEDHYDTEDFSIHLMKPDNIEQGTEAEWVVHIEKDDLPFTEADVRLEFWKTDEEKHDFVEAEEGNEGEYKVDWIFEDKGEHNIQIHVEKDELHEHIDRIFQVE